MPNFILGTFLVIIFSVQLGWFDVLGWEFGNYKKMVLPVVTLGVLPAAYFARITRASMLEVLSQDYIRTARAKGLAEWRVIFRHTIKNAMVPILTVMGPYLAFLITGSFIVERIFQMGLGRFPNTVRIAGAAAVVTATQGHQADEGQSRQRASQN